MLTKDNVTIGIEWQFGPDWQGQQCGAKTRRGTACQRPANKKNGRCRLHGGANTGASTDNIRPQPSDQFASDLATSPSNPSSASTRQGAAKL